MYPLIPNRKQKPVRNRSKRYKRSQEQNNDFSYHRYSRRPAVDEEMMNEIAALKKAAQSARNPFRGRCHDRTGCREYSKGLQRSSRFCGVVLTKLDGDTRGGAALSIRTVVNKPIKFVGTGEKMEALDVFHPERMADRILGMGDIVSLVERAQEQYDEEEARRLQKK